MPTTAEGLAVERLSARQRQILIYICDGLTNKEIASALQISVKTVDAHRMALRLKLGTPSVAAMIKLAIKAELIKV